MRAEERSSEMSVMQVADERAFSFLRLNERQQKPRSEGITEIRGPYYTPLGRHFWKTSSPPWAATWIR